MLLGFSTTLLLRFPRVIYYSVQCWILLLLPMYLTLCLTCVFFSESTKKAAGEIPDAAGFIRSVDAYMEEAEDSWDDFSLEMKHCPPLCVSSASVFSPSCFHTYIVLHPRPSPVPLLFSSSSSSLVFFFFTSHQREWMCLLDAVRILTERVGAVGRSYFQIPFRFFDYVMLRNSICNCENIREAVTLQLAVIFLDKTSISAPLTFHQ